MKFLHLFFILYEELVFKEFNDKLSFHSITKSINQGLSNFFIQGTLILFNSFAINVQFVNKNEEIITHTSAVRDIKGKHRSNQVCNLIKNVLQEFEIKKENILTIVTANTSSTIKTIEKLNENMTDIE